MTSHVRVVKSLPKVYFLSRNMTREYLYDLLQEEKYLKVYSNREVALELAKNKDVYGDLYELILPDWYNIDLSYDEINLHACAIMHWYCYINPTDFRPGIIKADGTEIPYQTWVMNKIDKMTVKEYEDFESEFFLHYGSPDSIIGNQSDAPSRMRNRSEVNKEHQLAEKETSGKHQVDVVKAISSKTKKEVKKGLRITIGFSVTEKEMLDRQAKREGLDLSSYIRHLLYMKEISITKE